MQPHPDEIENALAAIEASSGPSEERERIYWWEQNQSLYRRYNQERDLRLEAEWRSRRNGWLLLAAVIVAGIKLLVK